MSRRRREESPGIIREILELRIFYILYHSCLNICHHYLCGTKEQVSAGHPWNDPKRWRSASGTAVLPVPKNPKRFDIIVFPYQYEENTYYIKTAIGCQEETVR